MAPYILSDDSQVKKRVHVYIMYTTPTWDLGHTSLPYKDVNIMHQTEYEYNM